MKKKGLTIKINFSNRWIYFLITLGIIAIVAVGVYALSPGMKPNPGHDINETAPPADCADGTYLQWTGSDWACQTPQLSCHFENSSGTWSSDSNGRGYDAFKSCSTGGLVNGGCYCSGSIIRSMGTFLIAYPTGGLTTGWSCECSSSTNNYIVLDCCTNVGYNYGNTGFSPWNPPSGGPMM